MAYNPTAQAPTRGQAEFDDREIPSGVYLLGPAWLKIPSDVSWKARFDVLMGPFEGASTFVLQGRDTSKEGTRNRLYYYAKSAGIAGVELETTRGGSITEGALRSEVLGHVIKAKVTKKKTRRQNRDGVVTEFVDYDFQSFHPREEWSQAELDIAARWEAEYEETRSSESHGGGGGDWGGGGGSGGGGRSGAEDFDRDAPPPESEWDDHW